MSYSWLISEKTLISCQMYLKAHTFGSLSRYYKMYGLCEYNKKRGPQKYCITSEVLNLLVWHHRHKMVSSSSHIVSKAHGVKAGDLGVPSYYFWLSTYWGYAGLITIRNFTVALRNFFTVVFKLVAISVLSKRAAVVGVNCVVFIIVCF